MLKSQCPDVSLIFISKMFNQHSNISSGTIRENILFGLKYDQDQYDKVIEDCALVEDFLTLSAADSTYIGEGGTNLSGGQMQRINIGKSMSISLA